MPGEHSVFITTIPMYFDLNGRYSSNIQNGISFTVPQFTQIEIWNHGNRTKIIWSSSPRKRVRKIINMPLHHAKHLFKNKSA